MLNDKDILALRYFKAESIDTNALDKITMLAKKIRRDILSMVMQAGSGHVGGSLSSADVYLMLWLCAGITPENSSAENRDRIVISHGHTSPGLYSVLGNFGFFDIQEAVGSFRNKGSIFEGHPSSNIPGVEWGSGSLGQGLSVGCGFALAAKLKKQNNRVFVVMGDGEQQKGQITEACEFAVKHNLNNLTGIIDMNRLQASGSREDIMPSNLTEKYKSAGWDVITLDGHDYNEIYRALKYVSPKNRPVAILANTVMGKGFSAIENNYEYHGRLLSKVQYEEAIIELGGQDVLGSQSSSEKKLPGLKSEHSDGSGNQSENKTAIVERKVNIGSPRVYETAKPVECRTAAGEAIYDIIKNNPDVSMAVVDCDLMESVKTLKIYKEFPAKFIECGIQEHNAATVSGALSRAGVIPFFLDFGVFGIDETYGQHRMNDMNGASIKLIATHCGLDVGEDGKTHQCIDYISLVNNLSGYKLIIPADANQTDHIVRYIASNPGSFVVAMGRSKVPVLKNEKEDPFYSAKYDFNYGSSEWIREGRDAVIITTGTMVHRAVKASEELAAEDIRTGVLNISCPGKIDLNEIKKACATGAVVTYEDHFVQTGLGSIVASIIAENQLVCRFKKMGVVKYGKSCPAEEQYPLQCLDGESLKNTIRELNTANKHSKNKKLTNGKESI